MQVLHENFGYISNLIYGKWKTAILMLLFSVNVLCWEPSTPCRRISLIFYGFRENRDRWRPKVLISKILLLWHPILISAVSEKCLSVWDVEKEIAFLFRNGTKETRIYEIPHIWKVYINNLYFSYNFDPLSW